MPQTILPSNATPLELALEQAMSIAVDLPVDIDKLLRPEECPIQLLPWLAWQLSVDEWDVRWSEETKRAVVASSVYIHRHKGTKAAVNRALQLAHAEDAQLKEWFEPNGSGIPRTFWLTLPVSHPSIQSLLGQETLLKLVNAAKPVAAHPKMILLIDDAVIISTAGHHLMPLTGRVDNNRPIIDVKNFVANSNLPTLTLGGTAQQPRTPDVLLELPTESSSLGLVFANHLPKSDGASIRIVVNLPDGEAIDGQLILTAAMPDKVQAQHAGLLTQHLANTRINLGLSSQLAAIFSNQNTLSVQDIAKIVTRPVSQGKVEFGQLVLDFTLNAEHSQKYAGHLKQNQVSGYTHFQSSSYSRTLLLNQGKLAPPPIRLVQLGSPKLDVEIILGELWLPLSSQSVLAVDFGGHGKAELSKQLFTAIDFVVSQIVASNTLPYKRTACTVIHPSFTHAVIQNGQMQLHGQAIEATKLFTVPQMHPYLEPTQRLDLGLQEAQDIAGHYVQLEVIHPLRLLSQLNAVSLLSNQQRLATLANVGIVSRYADAETTQGMLIQRGTLQLADLTECVVTTTTLANFATTLLEMYSTPYSQLFGCAYAQTAYSQSHFYGATVDNLAWTGRGDGFSQPVQSFDLQDEITGFLTGSNISPVQPRATVAQMVQPSMQGEITPGKVTISNTLNATCPLSLVAQNLPDTTYARNDFVVDSHWLSAICGFNGSQISLKSTPPHVIRPYVAGSQAQSGQLEVTGQFSLVMTASGQDILEQHDPHIGLWINPTVTASCVIVAHQG